MLNIHEARARIAAQAVAIADDEEVALAEAAGRVLSKTALALVDVPPADNSAMDGYALKLPATPPPWTLPIAHTAAAGRAPQALAAGFAARILTGAEIPPGADTVVIQEDCERNGDTVIIRSAVQKGENIRPQGQDLRAGQTIAQRGDRLSAVHLGLLAASGNARVRVVRRPRVALISSGSELVAPGQPLAPGQIYNSNGPMLQSLLAGWGCEVVQQTVVADDLTATCHLLQNLAPQVDLLITSGGVSVGDADYLKAAIAQLGEVDLWKVHLKPGKPLAFGHIRQEAAATPVIALPGNPVSALVTALIFVKPFIEALLGRPYRELIFAWAPADFHIDAPRGRPEFVRARLEHGALSRFANQSSGVLSSLLWANALAWIDAGKTIAAGEPVPYLFLDDLTSLR